MSCHTIGAGQGKICGSSVYMYELREWRRSLFTHEVTICEKNARGEWRGARLATLISRCVAMDVSLRNVSMCVFVCVRVKCVRRCVHTPRPRGQSLAMPVDAGPFYAQYKGHPVDDLKDLKGSLPGERFIFLAGDSSLDNKRAPRTHRDSSTSAAGAHGCTCRAQTGSSALATAKKTRCTTRASRQQRLTATRTCCSRRGW